MFFHSDWLFALSNLPGPEYLDDIEHYSTCHTQHIPISQSQSERMVLDIPYLRLCLFRRLS